MENKKRKTNCLNCEQSYRGKDGFLHCCKGHCTSVTNYDCEDYIVFLYNKEDLYKMYQVVENIKNSKNKIPVPEYTEELLISIYKKYVMEKSIKLELEELIDIIIKK